MKRFTTLLAVALALSVGAGIAHAAAPKADKAAARADRKAAKAGGGAALAGTVSKVDSANIIVQTRGKNAAEITIATDANAKFEGAAASLADIKAGIRVNATPANGTAATIKVGAGRAAGKGGARAAKKAAK